ncbi:SMI1/KNR4 family protein [Amycolatopsis sp. NEAU-NG30]|uniref:SMI1/KNR4 family protein n=1 Tax=Amycolatopsis melonis TaxID=3156488 RepID=A0ABV0LTK5_9PSEU
MDRDAYLEAAVRDVLTGDADARIGHAALLLAASGAAADADRLVRQWQARTGRPVTALVPSAVAARAWEMLFEARGERPDWAAALPPLDLDAEERAHVAYLARPVSGFDGTPLAPVAQVVAPSRPDRLRAAVARGDLREWASLAGRQALPDVASLAASRTLAPRLAAGADPLGLGEWAGVCADALVAALFRRFPPDTGSWSDLVGEILRLRGLRTAPPPASPRAVDAAEARLGVRLPHREFLLTCDGLPADVVFPRLLGTAELRVVDDVLVLSDPAVLLYARGHVVEVDPVLGSTVHDSVRAVLEQHLRLLQQSA